MALPRTPENSITQKRLKEILHYDPETGIFTWKVKFCRKICIGDTAGHLMPIGYVIIIIKGVKYYAHRLAFIYMNGEPLKNYVDHLNHIKNDNRWVNLREVTRKANSRNQSMRKNNVSGFLGVFWITKDKRWGASIIVDDTPIWLGQYPLIIDAVAARIRANKKYGFHANHGR